MTRADLDQYVDQTQRKRFEELSLLAEQGDADAQNELASMYLEGTGTTCDSTKALAWYKRSAEQGHVDALYNIGCMFEYANGVNEDLSEAFIWYLKAAELGHDIAQVNVAEMLGSGRGVKENWLTALAWYEKAADEGNAWAQDYLAAMYKNGELKTNEKAKHWYLMSMKRPSVPQPRFFPNETGRSEGVRAFDPSSGEHGVSIPFVDTNTYK